MKVLYPGSFDPLTLGHLDLIKRSSDLFGLVVIAILENPGKESTFTIEKRMAQIHEATLGINNVEITTFNGLTVDCARKNNVDLIIRGLRAMSDFEYELQVAHTNRSLDSDFETIFLATETHYSFLSSSLVKEVARFGGNVNHMVPQSVANDLKSFYS